MSMSMSMLSQPGDFVGMDKISSFPDMSQTWTWTCLFRFLNMDMDMDMDKKKIYYITIGVKPHNIYIL